MTRPPPKKKKIKHCYYLSTSENQYVARTVCAAALAVPEILCVRGEVTLNSLDNKTAMHTIVNHINEYIDIRYSLFIWHGINLGQFLKSL